MSNSIVPSGEKVFELLPKEPGSNLMHVTGSDGRSFVEKRTTSLRPTFGKAGKTIRDRFVENVTRGSTDVSPPTTKAQST